LGFSSLAQKGTTGFGFGNVKTESPFGAATKTGTIDPRMVKPLFGTQEKDEKEKKDEPNPIEEGAKDHTIDIHVEDVNRPDSEMTSAEAKKAAIGFDVVDLGRTSEVPLDKLDDLLDEIGEGFHGEELDKQVLLLDPEHTGFVSRSGFIKWYCELVEGSDDDDSGGSLDTEEREEREEERQKAIDVFESVAGGCDEHLTGTNFKDVLEGLGSTYCEEEHRRTIRKISDDDGKISLAAFLSWYIEWLFGEEEDSLSEEEDNEDITNDEDVTKGAWGESFGRNENKWKCDTCMAPNEDSVNECACCGAVRPGYEGEEVSAIKLTSTSSAFTFSAVGASIPSELQSKDEEGASQGFSFGFDSKQTPPPAPAVPVVKEFQFGFNSAKTALEETKTKEKPPVSGGYPPMSTSAPKPFGKVSTETKKTAAADSGGYPPVAPKAPTPFGSSSAVKDKKEKAPLGFNFGNSTFGSAPQGGATSGFSFAKPSQKESSSGYPPVASKAPSPFGGTGSGTKETKEKPSVSGGYPPMSTSAPKPFGKGSNPSSVINYSGSDIPSRQIQPETSSFTPSSFAASSEYEVQFWNVVNEFHCILTGFESEGIENSNNFESDRNRVVSMVERMKSTSFSIANKLSNIEEQAIMLLSKNDDIERQIQESKQCISQQVDRNGEGDFSKSQPLDSESEKIRRRLNNKAIFSQRLLSRAHEKLVLTEKMNKLRSRNRSSVSFTSPLRQRRPTHDPTKETIKLLFDSLKNGYDRTQDITALSQSLLKRAENESANFPSIKDESQEVKRKTWKGRDLFDSRGMTPFTHKLQSTTHFSSSEIRGVLGRLKTEDCVLNCFNHRDLIHRKKVNKDFIRFGSNEQSKLMSSVSTRAASASFMSPFKNSSEVRQGWDKTDESQIDAIQLPLPSSISKIDASSAARRALVPFGTTPEKMTKAHIVRKIGKQNEIGAVVNQKSTGIHKVEITSQKKETRVEEEPLKAGNFTFSTSKAKGEPKNSILSTKNEAKQAIKFDTPTQTQTETTRVAKKVAFGNSSSGIVAAPIDSQNKGVKESTPSPFGNISGLGSSLDESGISLKKSTTFIDVSNTQKQEAGAIDYVNLLSDFYKIHNPRKMGEIGATLMKYKVRVINHDVFFECLYFIIIFLS
jgi:Ca2+-binding EF-hand superfamily protein